MKRVMSLMLAISMILSLFMTSLAATTKLDDIAGTKYAGAVEALVELGVIDGFPNGTYGPEKEVTRAQLAKMLVVSLGLGDTVGALEGRTMFTDVEGEHWASGYINAAVQSKIIVGYPDGTFKPEKSVTYAEAITMAIRALGYGNVVDTEGTWPTAYMLKAVELELLDDMGSPKANENALRGNVAILLWNMLRTPMWKIDSENETNGMTSRAGSIMLNVKFPDYLYVEDAYLTDVSVDDNEVTAEVSDKDGDFIARAELKDVDLSRLILGMKISTLIKDYKDSEDATFLTLTPEYSFVEGLVTKVTSTRIEIDDVEYRVEDADVSVDDYVVAEVNGKKINTYDDEAVIKVLPTKAIEVEKIKTMESRIDEDALVIIDGEWASREDIELQDMYTAMDEFGDTYYMVARERVEGVFDSLSLETEGDKDTVIYLEIDGEEYRGLASNFKVYEGEDNDEEVELDALLVKEKDNKYLDKDVELVLNYLGQVVKVNFGKVPELDAAGNFYAITSDGVWYTSSSSGKKYHVVLASVDGEVETYDFASSTVAKNEIGEDWIYEAGEPVFVWAKFNDSDEIKDIAILKAGENYGDYKVESFSGEMTDDNYLSNGSKVTASTIVFTVTPVEDDDENVIGFNVEVSQGPDALDGVEEGLLAYDTTATNMRAKYVFVAEDAKSQDLHFGLVEKLVLSRGIRYVDIDGERYKVDEDSDDFVVDTVAIFTDDDGTVTLKKSIATTELDDAAIVSKVEDEFVTFLEGATEDMLTEAKKDFYEDYDVVTVSAYIDSENKVVFDEVEVLGEGIEAARFKKGNRIIEIPELEVYLIVTGLEWDDVIENGKFVGEYVAPVEPEQPTEPEQPVEPEQPIEPEQPSGDNNGVSGDNNETSGDNNETSGDNNEVSGDNNETSGDNNEVSGDNNQTEEDSEE